MYDMILRQAKLSDDGPSLDIAIEGSHIALLQSSIKASGRIELQAHGNLVLPPFIEAHTHLDTALTAGSPEWNVSGTLSEGIQLWQKRKQLLTQADVQERALKVIHQYVSHGVLHIRSHADISEPHLTGLRALLKLKKQVASYLNLQVVAFPQDGIFRCPENQSRLEEALRLGADGIGAVPHLESSPEDGIRSLQFVFSLAKQYGTMVHVFCDETDDADSKFLEVMAQLALESRLQHRVTASHATASAYYSEDYFRSLAPLVAESGMNIVVCPNVNSMMQARHDSFPKSRGIARLKEFWQQGVSVSIAHDDMMSPFYPFGNANLLQSAFIAAHLAHMSSLEEIKEVLHMVTTRAARTLQIEAQYGIEEGKPANLIVMPFSRNIDLLRFQPKPTHVIYDGRIVAETPVTASQLFLS